MEKAREFQKNMHFFFIDYTKDLDCVYHNKQWNIPKEIEIPDHLTCLLRSLYVDHKATVRTRHVTMGWFKIGKGVQQGYILSPCLFNFDAEYSCKMSDWMNQELESRSLEEITRASDMQMIPL